VRYACSVAARLEAVRRVGALNAIDYLEVSDADAPSDALRQRTLFVRLLQPPPAFTEDNVVIDGGERVSTVGVEWVKAGDDASLAGDPIVDGLDDPALVLVVRTSVRGDFSRYTLRLVAASGMTAPPAGFDPMLASVEFSFKVDCQPDFDCHDPCRCVQEPRVRPPIDYLAKDYDGFRALLLDRLSLLAPGWTERNGADLGMTLVELLAYLGDELSYRQDAVATDAYLATARRRTSLRRHARLVDYLVHEGSNARAWVRVFVEADTVIEQGTRLLTRVEGQPARLVPGGAQERAALRAAAETFEVVEQAALSTDLEALDLWTWGDSGCCLQPGATSATLRGDHPALKAGDVLVLAEVVSPTTGSALDADPAKRVAVRLTSVTAGQDLAGGAFADPPTATAVDITEIAWDEEDALAFSLCVSTPDIAVVSRAWGNVVLADHGRTVTDEDLGAVPEPVLDYALVPTCDPHARHAEPVPARYRPTLAFGPLAHAGPAPSALLVREAPPAPVLAGLLSLTFAGAVGDWVTAKGVHLGDAVLRGGDGHWSVSDGDTVVRLRRDGADLLLFAASPSAAATLASDPRRARPAIVLESTLNADTARWHPQADLLASDQDAPEFVVEVEHDRAATLRFGDGRHGRRPPAGTEFAATYRVGNGTAGNVGAGALAHVATADGAITGVANPLPARGGAEPEDADAVRRDAPEAFLVQQRAVTADDYARMTERDRRVQRAAATFRWTGSWHTVFVTADRVGGGAIDAPFEDDVRAGLEPVRMAGYDLEVDGPRLAPLEVGLHVCALPDYFRGHVRAALLDVLTSGLRTDGAPGLFHPDRFTFGTPVYLSPIVAAAQAVEGVMSVTATLFQRQRDPSTSALDSGVLQMGRLEIAQLADDPSFPERGTLTLTLGGGK
jgi:hypothetical protein